MDQKHQTLLIWDSQNTPPAGYQNITLWCDFDCDLYPNAISLPKIIEQHADSLKTRYLKLTYNLVQTKINGKSIVRHLQLYPDFNYWWMTLLNEKCNWAKSLWINDAIRMLAFEDWSVNKKIKKLKLVTANKKLVKCFRLFCEEKKLSFKWQYLPEAKERQSAIKRIFHVLPNPIKALVWLGYYVSNRRPLKSEGIKEWESTKGRITFVSYYDNLDVESINKNKFNSPYWAHLPEVLLKEGEKTNWLHLYVKDRVLPSARKASNTIYNFNQSNQGEQIHTTLAAFICWKVICSTLIDWMRLFKVGRKLRRLGSIDMWDISYLWPFIQLDLKESLFGKTALKNLLYFNLFKQALKLLPKQGKGIYLQENQGWEFGLIQAWKSAGHGDLIGVPHSTVRFWDLRYFFDVRNYNGDISKQLPRPDVVAVNGKAARESYFQGGYPQNELVDVEALRYLHLKNSSKKPQTEINKKNLIRILVLGEIIAENTHFQMRILEEAFQFFSINVSIIVKPHPNCPIIAEDYPNLSMKISMDSIPTLLKDCDVAYTSNVTSAAIDAYYSNIPVISVLEPGNLNMSPLRGLRNVKYISTAKQLTKTLKMVLIKQNNDLVKQDYFIVDSSLNKWRRLLLTNS